MSPPWTDFETPTDPKPSVARRLTRKLLIGIGAFALLIAGIWEVQKAWAHEAPAGWQYPYACCSGIDCRPVSKKAISERPSGFVINSTGEVIAPNDTRLRESPDGEYHWCTVAGEDHSRTICLFVPPRGM